MICNQLQRQLLKLFRLFWGNLTSAEIKKFSLLSLTFLFTIGSYWLLRSLKDAILASTVGINYQPLAKILSGCLLIPLILLYSKLVDIFEKHKLFYAICPIYIAAFSFIAYFLMHPTIGLANRIESPTRLLGWVSYVTIESFGSIGVTLFWSFVASSTSSESAKRGFPMIISGAQFGAIAGPTLARFAPKLGLPTLMFIATTGIAMIMVVIKIFMKVVPQRLSGIQQEESTKQKPKTGMFEGIKLLISRPYILGIFGIAVFYEIVGTMIDFQFKLLARSTYITPESFASFMGLFGQCANGFALLFALFGTHFFMQRFGLPVCLILFPTLVGVIVGSLFLYPILAIAFIGMMSIKALSYALNNPSKEVMYIPTSKDVKFKAKGWIDMFGNRSAKATGSFINTLLYLKESLAHLMNYGIILSGIFIACWLLAARYVGKTFSSLIKRNKIIE